MKIFKLASKSEGILLLIKAITETLVDLSNFSLLLSLYIFVCALVGMDMFAYRCRLSSDGIPLTSTDEGYDQGVSPRLNFDDFPASLLTVFVLLVNEDWN